MKIKAALDWAKQELIYRQEGHNDALFLLSAVSGKDKAALIAFGEDALTTMQWQKFQQFIALRKQHKPVSQILGTQPFWLWEFKVSSDVLTPRADSEVLIEGLLEDFTDKSQNYKIADFGTGSGCLLLSALSEYPQACGYGLDISEKALNMAKQNEDYVRQQGALFTDVTWILGSWGNLKKHKPFDIILANPPYIAKEEEKDLKQEVKQYEPHMALFAENEGLQAYEALFPLFKEILSPRGKAYVEHGYRQQEAVIAIAEKAGLKLIKKLKDLAHHPRGIVLGQF